MRSNREIVLAAVRRDGVALAYASEDLRGDAEVLAAAAASDASSLQYASETMRNEYEIPLGRPGSIRTGAPGSALRHIGEQLQRFVSPIRPRS
eukprot:symbB.v1.2.025294.t1/scaffold2445.1/size151041/22